MPSGETMRHACREELVVVATYRNRTGRPVALPYCNRTPGVPPSFYLEKRVDGGWVQAYVPSCLAVGVVDPPLVGPGQAVTDTLRIVGYTTANTIPRFEIRPVAGTYRLVYLIHEAPPPSGTGRGRGELLPKEARVSNEFQIEDAE